MLPCGVLFCGETWDSVVDELKYFVALDRLNISCKCHSESDNRPSMTWWKSQCMKLKNGNTSPNDFLDNIQSQLQCNIHPRYHEPTGSLCDFVRELCSSRSVRDDCALSLFFHLLLSTFQPNVTSDLLSTQVQFAVGGADLQKIHARIGELSLEQTAHELERLTSAFERALSLGLYNPDGVSPRHLSLCWTRLAYRLSTQYVIQCHSEVPDMFLTALRFLLILEVADVDTWRCAALCLPRPMYFALTGLLSTSTQEAHQTAPSSGNIFPESPGTTLLNRFLIELENLVELANRFDAFGTATTKGGGSLSKLACILFDRLACLTFFATGATHKTHPSLWNTLYEETQAKSVELWCAFWLESDNNRCLHD
ncbi:hypothetical protein AHF37_08655 [Paragonimus kellicotti]|nr:hypothetical protein AHF37_08655 [Paragonimus kellicotti]